MLEQLRAHIVHRKNMDRLLEHVQVLPGLSGWAICFFARLYGLQVF